MDVVIETVFANAIAQGFTRRTQGASGGGHIKVMTFQRGLDDMAVHVVEGHAAVQRQTQTITGDFGLALQTAGCGGGLHL